MGNIEISWPQMIGRLDPGFVIPYVPHSLGTNPEFLRKLSALASHLRAGRSKT